MKVWPDFAVRNLMPGVTPRVDNLLILQQVLGVLQERLDWLLRVLAKGHGRVWDEGDQQPYLQDKINGNNFSMFIKNPTYF